ncbi:MAG: hypothetical protein GY848_17565 [Methyloversatilis sp.]|jgi:hypothetical protein|uniref:FeoB-associated Cys-rich membrane protein n=1 Tax=Methyloversatilis universalis (strain ATCC BAA-1314 / DSM 25237 / JCM 13912 / CCUG 52030 / FAM5) TaxID=1000565 RepID=F5RAU2_METUF|nr:hypothetical protein [Methyloversatilis universalis]EGK72313.1 hypothetical protein METUNv1_01429 [Methyloversatilis universalis FAM5]MCP4638272.1 hypothetical protein [Methyloversatilis sp.]
MNGLTDLIALAIVALCAGVVLRRAWRWLAALRSAGSAGACGGCSGCDTGRSADRRGGCS